MAIIQSPRFKSLQGKLGNLIIYKVNKQTRVRSAAIEFHDANSPAQQANRRRLYTCVRFYQQLKNTFLRKAWQAAAAHSCSPSGYALYLKRNMNVFLPDGSIADFSRLILCPGHLPPADNLTLHVHPDGSLSLSWKNHVPLHSIRNVDTFQVAYLQENQSFTIHFADLCCTYREEEKTTFTIEHTPGIPTHLYCFFTSPDGNAYSENVYFRIP